MKTIVANGLLGLIAYFWYQHIGRLMFFANCPFGLLLLIVGIGLGIWCAQPNRTRRRQTSPNLLSQQPSVTIADPFENITN